MTPIDQVHNERSEISESSIDMSSLTESEESEHSQASEASVDPESLQTEDEPSGETLDQDNEARSTDDDEDTPGSLADFIDDDLITPPLTPQRIINLFEDSSDEQPVKRRRM